VTWWNVPFKFTSKFPIISQNALRIYLVEPKTISALFHAAWVDDVPIGNVDALLDVLNKAGFNGKELLEKSQTKEIKEKLFSNNERAFNAGVFGVPSFQVNGQEAVFGQDRLDLVSDLLCGWNSKL
jgi:2-hydroxychromene-2-carboxylate isomerase